MVRTRNGETTEEDWFCQGLLQTLQILMMLSTCFIFILFYNKDKTPIARINAKHSCSIASSTKADGLQPVLLIAKGAKVMLKSRVV